MSAKSKRRSADHYFSHRVISNYHLGEMKDLRTLRDGANVILSIVNNCWGQTNYVDGYPFVAAPDRTCRGTLCLISTPICRH